MFRVIKVHSSLDLVLDNFLRWHFTVPKMVLDIIIVFVEIKQNIFITSPQSGLIHIFTKKAGAFINY